MSLSFLCLHKIVGTCLFPLLPVQDSWHMSLSFRCLHSISISPTNDEAPYRDDIVRDRYKANPRAMLRQAVNSFSGLRLNSNGRWVVKTCSGYEAFV